MIDGLDVSRETILRLELFADTLRRWNQRINLVASNTLPDLWSRHIIDSAQLLELAPLGDSWVDLGSGGGLPGMVVAIVAREVRPDLHVTLIESDRRKAEFLRSVARDCAPGVVVLAERVETAPAQNGDIVSARALAPLSKLLDLVVRHLAPTGTAILPKGRNVLTELDQARREWQFDVTLIPSRTDPQARILFLKDITRA